jgi:hypothetical protein
LCFFYEVNSDFVRHSDTLIPCRQLATLFAFHANTLLFLTARKTLKPSRHDLLHYLLKVEREASPIRMDITGRRLAAKHGGPKVLLVSPRCHA